MQILRIFVNCKNFVCVCVLRYHENTKDMTLKCSQLFLNIFSGIFQTDVDQLLPACVTIIDY